MDNAETRVGAGEHARRLLTALADSSGGLEQLVRLGYEMLGNPIAITDRGWQAIAMTDDVDAPGDRHWDELLQTGRLPADAVTSGVQSRLAVMIEGSDAPFIWQGEGMRYPRMICRIALGGKTAATVSVIECCRPFQDGDMELLALFRDAAAAELQKNGFMQSARGMSHEDFIESLLSGKLTDPVAAEERSRLFGIGFKRNIYVFAFDLSEYDPLSLSVTYMRDTLERMITGGRGLIYDGRIVITASFARAREAFKTELESLGNFLKDREIRCGISRRCTELVRLRYYYDQALDALRVGSHMDRGRYIYPYGEYAEYHIAEACAARGGADAFCHPALIKLIAYDAEYGTAFTESLYAYLSCFRSLSKAAVSLSLHRNTLLYHIKRAGEIMEVDLNDHRAQRLIEFSFTLLEYEKRFDLRRSPSGEFKREN